MFFLSYNFTQTSFETRRSNSKVVHLNKFKKMNRKVIIAIVVGVSIIASLIIVGFIILLNNKVSISLTEASTEEQAFKDMVQFFLTKFKNYS